MKITGMRIENLTTRDHTPADGVGAQRSAAPLDVYEEYAKMGDDRLGPKTRRDHCWRDKSEWRDGTAETPGIGEDINWDIVEKREVIHEFAF